MVKRVLITVFFQRKHAKVLGFIGRIDDLRCRAWSRTVRQCSEYDDDHEGEYEYIYLLDLRDGCKLNWKFGEQRPCRYYWLHVQRESARFSLRRPGLKRCRNWIWKIPRRQDIE